MKSIILTLIAYFTFFITLVSASVDVSFDVDKNSLNINNTLDFTLELSSDEVDNYEIIDIVWVENFDVIWQQKSSSYKSINWATSIITNISLELKAKKNGSYALWPIKMIINWKKEDFWEVEVIEVVWDKIFIGNTSDLLNFKIWEEEIPLANLPPEGEGIATEENNNNVVSSLPLEEIERWVVKDLDWKDMLDIYDIKKNLYGFPINIVLTLYYIVFFLIIYYLYKLYLKSRKKLEEIVFKPEAEIKKDINYIKLIRDVEKKYLKEQKEVFYAKLAEVIRLYLDDKIKLWLSAKTLKEIKWEIKTDLYDLIEKVYFPEYDRKEDSLEQRENILKQTKNLLR